MDVARGLELLEHSGTPGAVRIESASSDSVRLTSRAALRTATIRAVDVPPNPARVDRALERLERGIDAVFYIVPRLTTSLRRRALADPRLIVAAVDQRSVIIDGVKWHEERVATPPPAPRGRKPWGRHALQRVLVRSSEPRTQAQLATETGISQQAVALALPALSRLGVERRQGGWVGSDPGTLWDAFMNEYPGPAGIRRGWMSVAPLGVQSERALELAHRAGVRALTSGDGAADLVAPLRRPVVAALYATSDLDLATRSAPAVVGEQTLFVVVPADPTIFETARAWAADDGHLTDPLITAWELSRSRGPDREDALAHLKDVTISNRITV